MFKRIVLLWLGTAALAGALATPPAAHAGDSKVLGRLEFDAGNKPAKDAGVWIDGDYLGYLTELKGSRKLLLIPGEHEVTVRQVGFQDFHEKVIIEPNKKTLLRVAMARDPNVVYPTLTAEVKMDVDPDRAAVFVDNRYAGHAHEFSGARGMLVSPGSHRIKIELPGYKTFETEVTLVASQKFQVKTQLVQGSITDASPAIKH